MRRALAPFRPILRAYACGGATGNQQMGQLWICCTVPYKAYIPYGATFPLPVQTVQDVRRHISQPPVQTVQARCSCTAYMYGLYGVHVRSLRRTYALYGLYG